MSLEQRGYSILVVSAVESFNSALADLLPESTYSPVRMVTDISTAKRTLAERPFDFVIVNSPLPDDAGVRFAIDACTTKGTVVLLLVKSDAYIGVYDKVVVHGVFALSKPVSKQSILMALSWMASARERLRKIEKKTLSIEDKMEEIRLVNRAKWLLISELRMDEPQAHRYIEKQAMDQCVSRRQVAEEIIRTYT
ncbi:MAG: ANTAR domain-containing protein [bacterium]|nr:ANTAR domain-containing protein [bacterium]